MITYQKGAVNLCILYKSGYTVLTQDVKLQASKKCITVKQKSIIIYRDLETACLVKASWDCSLADESIYTKVLSEPATITVIF